MYGGIGVAVITNTWGGCTFFVHNRARWGHTETMLLVNHNQTERSKIHRIFNDGMGTYQYMYVSRQQTGKDSFAPLALNRTGQQFHTYLHSIQQLTDGFIVLVCQKSR